MGIRQRQAICWLLLGPEDTRPSPLAFHYPTQEAADEAAERINDAGGDVEPVRLMEPCWVAICGHGIALRDDCGLPLHSITEDGFASPGTDAGRGLRAAGWSITPAGRIVRCAPLTPGDRAPGRDAIDMTIFEAGLRFTAREAEAE